MKLKKLCVCVLSMVLCLSAFSGCTPGVKIPGEGDDDEVITIRLLTTGWVNTPINVPEGQDPFKKYLREKYKIDLVLDSYEAGNFESQLSVALAGSQKPDLIRFASLAQFEKFYQDASLVDDWGKWLDDMPTMKASMQSNANAYNRILGENGKPKALFGNSDNTWGLKVRQDWLDDYGQTSGYKIKDAQDMLGFAEWVKTTKNEDGGTGKIDAYTFTSAGEGNQIGTSLEWTQGLFGHTINGLSNEPARGFYITADKKDVSNPVIDGSYKQWLEFLRTCVDNNYLDANWFSQKWGDKSHLARQQKLAFEYYPGSLVQEIYFEHFTNPLTNYGEDCVNWYQNMEMPSSGKAQFDGLPQGVDFGHIWTVSYNAARNAKKMARITKLLNDLPVVYDETKTGPEYFQRSELYDAMRYGLNILDGIKYVNLENSNYQLCDLKLDLKPGEVDFRGDNPGSYDYGAWFSTANDGIATVSGATEISKKVAAKIGALNEAAMRSKKYITPGSMFVYDAVALGKMFDEYVAFTYAYATRSNKTDADTFINKWRTELKGNDMLVKAKEQFKALGYMD